MEPFIFIEASIIGIITYIICIIIFNLTINKKNKNREELFGLHIAFFATGFFLYFIIALIGLNKYIYDKQDKY
jgi:hypothetical protein